MLLWNHIDSTRTTTDNLYNVPQSLEKSSSTPGTAQAIEGYLKNQEIKHSITLKKFDVIQETN